MKKNILVVDDSALMRRVIFGVWIDKELSFKCILYRLNPSSVEKVMVVFLRLRRLNSNCARLCSTLILGTLLCESCFVS